MNRKDLLASFNTLFMQQPSPLMCWDHAQASAAAPALQNSLPTNVPSKKMTFFPLVITFLNIIFLHSYPTSCFLRQNETCAYKPTRNSTAVCPREEMLLFSQLLVLQLWKTKQKTDPNVST